MHDSFMPLSGLALMLNMQIGEVIFGGVGAGLYGMLLFVVLAVFLAGLMVGRTPEYLGKKIEAREVKLAVLAFLSMPLGILVFGAFAATVPAALAAVQDPGPHGFSEILYAYTLGDGQQRLGLRRLGRGAAVPHHAASASPMLLGRFAFIVPMLAIAGSLAAKTPRPPSAGTFPTHGPLFVVLLDRDGADPRRAHLLPGAGARPDRRKRSPRPPARPSDPERSHVPQSRAAALHRGALHRGRSPPPSPSSTRAPWCGTR